ncbi:hypothetical protein G7085_11615 [Tessaracoccus sp. HDW20]|uniref:hypothetical protein n=1 Tax=Tessaracoccus coleopterorum TaxID=2714950 RepID=UPI0018D39CAD|nr:hypothetical protein [Tessaracoccus coleopterorum]NHB85035.1 hypothetical protein [Tessaracoccus coleopterorum]
MNRLTRRFVLAALSTAAVFSTCLPTVADDGLTPKTPSPRTRPPTASTSTPTSTTPRRT